MIITLTIFLFLCGIAGFILNRNNVILLIVAIELLLLAVAFINSCFTPYSSSLVSPPLERWQGRRALLRLCCFACKGRGEGGNWSLSLPLFFDITYSYKATTYFANEQLLIIFLILLILVFLGLNLILWLGLNSYYNSVEDTSSLRSMSPFRALLRYIADMALLRRRRVRCSIKKFSQHLKLLLLIFVVAIILLNFSDEIYSNIHNNYNYYLFLIYKSCLDLLSFFGLYFRMVINNLFTLWWCQLSGGGLSPQTLNEAPSLIQEEVAQSGGYARNGSSLPSSDFISSNLDDITLYTTFLAENIEDINSSTDFNNDFNSSFSDEQNFRPGLDTQRIYNLPSGQVVESNSSEETVREDQVPSAVFISAQPSEVREKEKEMAGCFSADGGAQFNSSGEESSSSAKNISTGQPTTFNQNQLPLSSEPTEHFVSSDDGGLNSSLPIQAESSVAAEIAQSEATDQSKSTTTIKTVTFNPKSKILEFEHSLEAYNPYFDISDSREIDTKIEDGLGALNKDYPTKRIVSNFEDQSLAGFTSTVSVQENKTLEEQPMASSSSKILEDQPVAGLSTSQDSVNNIVTDLDIFGAIEALKTKGFISSSFNISGFTSSDSNVATDTTSLSEIEISTTTISDSPTDSSSSSGTEPEANEGTNNIGKKRNLPSDLEESDLAPKRKKTD